MLGLTYVKGKRGIKPNFNNNQFISGGIGARNISNRRALYRRASKANCCTKSTETQPAVAEVSNDGAFIVADFLS